MELDKATYERAGLQGQAMRDGGLKHVVNRYGKLHDADFERL